MRFPTPKMVMDYSNFTLGIKNVDAQFTVEPWTSAISSKGQLQQAWFRVRGIPVDQRGLRTIAKIGGLVGKTMAIDEGTRFSKDFVRVKIACRNIDLVPSSAESTLGLFLYDFFFERELSQEERMDKLNTKISVEEQDPQPSPKKPRTEPFGGTPEKEATKEYDKSNTSQGGKYSGKACLAGEGKLSSFAPSKFFSSKYTVASDLLQPSGKQGHSGLNRKENENMSLEETIPAATYEPSGETNDGDKSGADSDESCGYVNEVHKILGHEANSSRRNEDLFMARCDHLNSVASLLKTKSSIKDLSDPLGLDSQSVALDPMKEDTHSETVLNMENLCNPSKEMKALRQERRCSERVLQNMNVNSNTSMEKLSNKRALEGNNASVNSFSILNNEEIVARSLSMGVNIDSCTFASIDMLKELENARIALAKKTNQKNVLPEDNCPSPITSDGENLDPDGMSEFEDFILVTSKRNRKPTKRFSLSGRKPPKIMGKEIPCSSSVQGTMNKESPCGATKNKKSRNKKS